MLSGPTTSCVGRRVLLLTVLSGIAVPTPLHADEAERARAWATIAAIHESSIFSLEWNDRVFVHLDEETQLLFAEYHARADDLRRMRVSGRRCYADPIAGDPGKVDLSSHRCEPLEWSLQNGVVFVVVRDRDVGVARVERPEELYPWCVPSPLKGIGHVPFVHDVQSRAELLLSSPTLRVLGENVDWADGQVVLACQVTGEHLEYELRVVLDRETGRTQRHQIVDPVWRRVSADWVFGEWLEADGVFVPQRVEYRMFALAIDAATRAAVAAERERRAIPPNAMSPSHAKYAQWCEVLDDYFGVEGVPVRLAAPWQHCETSIVSINGTATPAWFDLPMDDLPTTILSDALECPVDGPWLEPSAVTHPSRLTRPTSQPQASEDPR